MRIFCINGAYPLYIKKVYEKHKNLYKRPYAEQRAVLDYDAFAWADFWSHAMSPFGYEMMEVTSNLEPLQKVWAAENVVNYQEQTWKKEIILAQIKKFRPTVLFNADFHLLSYPDLMAIKSACPSLRCALVFVNSPHNDLACFQGYDVVLSASPLYLEEFRRRGHQAEQLMHAFDPRVLDRIDRKQEPFINFSFIGQIIRLPNFHVQREQVLQELVRQIDLEIFSPSFEVTRLDEASAFSRYLIYTFMNFLKSHYLPAELLKKIPILGRALSWPAISPRLVSPALKGHLKPPVFGLDMFQTLWNSKVTLNIDGDNDRRFAINLRLFEATGVGTCLVTNWKENLPQLFALDTEVVTYKTVAECLEKVRWLLDHPRERQAIAAAGQARVLREHTFALRAVKLDEIIKKVLRDKN
jgi:spore maturation protein CgeB